MKRFLGGMTVTENGYPLGTDATVIHDNTSATITVTVAATSWHYDNVVLLGAVQGRFFFEATDHHGNTRHLAMAAAGWKPCSGCGKPR